MFHNGNWFETKIRLPMLFYTKSLCGSEQGNKGLYNNSSTANLGRYRHTFFRGFQTKNYAKIKGKEYETFFWINSFNVSKYMNYNIF